MTGRVKKTVEGGEVFRAATGDWTYRLDGERLWRTVHLDSEDAAVQAVRDGQRAVGIVKGGGWLEAEAVSHPPGRPHEFFRAVIHANRREGSRISGHRVWRCTHEHTTDTDAAKCARVELITWPMPKGTRK